MKPQATLDRVNNETGKKTDRIELFFYKNGLLLHRHSLIEDTENNRELFPVHRKFWNKLYTTQELMICPDEAEELLKLFSRKEAEYLMSRFFRHNWFTRLLWKFTLKVTLIWQKRQSK